MTIDRLDLRVRPPSETPPEPGVTEDRERLRATIREILREELERLDRREAR